VRFLQYIPLLILFGCLGIPQKYPTLKSNYWISEKFDYYPKDSITGIELMYGSAYFLNLNSNQEVRFLSGDFYWKNDSLYQGGEPGITLKAGNWKVKDSLLILSQKLIERTIMRISDTIGQIETDTLRFVGDSIIIYRRSRLVPVKKVSKELKEFMACDRF
jgi:hypothetical protein